MFEELKFIHKFTDAFVPLFVAIDAVGMVAVYIALTQGLTNTVKKRLVSEATLTALAISVVFLIFGKVIFRTLGITDNDFRIAGGLVLLILAIVDLLFSQHESRRGGDESVGVVPIGIPLIMGPAALTTILISQESFGFWVTLTSLFVNLAIAWLVFRYADMMLKLVGRPGTRAIAKVMALFLAAIAVMMIRVGILGIVAGR